MPQTISACRCGQPMTQTGTGALYCEHCDRGCTKGTIRCANCRNFDRACDPNCGCKN